MDKMTETEYSDTFITHFCIVADLLRETVKQVGAAVEFEANMIKDNAVAENRPVRPSDYDKLNGAYNFRDRLEKLCIIAEAFKERYVSADAETGKPKENS